MTYRIEVMPVGVKTLAAIAEAYDGFRVQFDWLDWSCQYCTVHGKQKLKA